MGSRYTKSIPEFVYFTDCGNGWYGGPFVKNPNKGKNANNDGLIICKVQVVPRLVTESNFSPEIQEGIKKVEKMGEVLLTDIKELQYGEPKPQISGNIEELQKLEAWLKSDVGRDAIRQAQIDADKAFDALGLRDIDPKKLREPFTI